MTALGAAWKTSEKGWRVRVAASSWPHTLTSERRVCISSFSSTITRKSSPTCGWKASMVNGSDIVGTRVAGVGRGRRAGKLCVVPGARKAGDRQTRDSRHHPTRQCAPALCREPAGGEAQGEGGAAAGGALDGEVAAE